MAGARAMVRGGGGGILMGAPEFYDNGQAVKAPIWAISIN